MISLVCYRSQSLQRAKMAYKNYSNDYDNLNSWLSRVPNYEPHETDDTRQVETKLKNQRVSVMNSRAVYILHIAGAKEYSAAKKKLIPTFLFSAEFTL